MNMKRTVLQVMYKYQYTLQFLKAIFHFSSNIDLLDTGKSEIEVTNFNFLQ